MENGFNAAEKMGGKVIVTGGGNRFHVTTITNVQGHVTTSNTVITFIADMAV